MVTFAPGEVGYRRPVPSREDAGGTVDKLGAAAIDAVFGIPGSGVVAEWLFGKVREEVTHSRSIALLVAEQRSGLSREDIAERIAEDPRLVALFIRLLYAAGMTKHEQTLRAMGAAFGQAVGERDFLDECELILTALADLTANHAAILLLLSTDPPELAGGPNAWTPDRLVRSSELPARATTLCLAALVARGLAETPTGFGGLTICSITSLGREVLEVLRAYSETTQDRPRT